MSEAANRPKVKLPAFLCRREVSSVPPEEHLEPQVDLAAAAIDETALESQPKPRWIPPAGPEPDEAQWTLAGTTSLATGFVILCAIRFFCGSGVVVDVCQGLIITIMVVRESGWKRLCDVPLPPWSWTELAGMGAFLTFVR